MMPAKSGVTQCRHTVILGFAVFAANLFVAFADVPTLLVNDTVFRTDFVEPLQDLRRLVFKPLYDQVIRIKKGDWVTGPPKPKWQLTEEEKKSKNKQPNQRRQFQEKETQYRDKNKQPQRDSRLKEYDDLVQDMVGKSDTGSDPDTTMVPLGQGKEAYGAALTTIRQKYMDFHTKKNKRKSHFWVAVVPQGSPVKKVESCTMDTCVFMRIVKATLFGIQFNNLYVGGIQYEELGVSDLPANKAVYADGGIQSSDLSMDNLIPRDNDHIEFTGKHLFLVILAVLEASRFQWIEQIVATSLLPEFPDSTSCPNSQRKPVILNQSNLYRLVENWAREGAPCNSDIKANQVKCTYETLKDYYKTCWYPYLFADFDKQGCPCSVNTDNYDAWHTCENGQIVNNNPRAPTLAANQNCNYYSPNSKN